MMSISDFSLSVKADLSQTVYNNYKNMINDNQPLSKRQE
jgi:hypothetical protein